MCRAVSGPSRYVLLLAALTALAALLAGCAQFPDAGQQPWRERPDLSAERAPQPQLPETGEPTPAPNSDGPSVPPPCVDPDPAGRRHLPRADVRGRDAAGRGRRPGRRAHHRPHPARRPRETPETVATVPVDAAGDGGLTSLALSPSYAEDQLVYAYATTPGGNAVLRIAPGDVPKTVLGGIPRGASGNSGAVGVEPDGTLLVATGDGGDRAAAASPTSLAGKLLRIDPFGAARARHARPGVAGRWAAACTPPATSARTRRPASAGSPTGPGPRDVLLAVRPGVAPGPDAAAAPAWTWPERPGVAGCAALPGTLVVGLRGSSAMFVLRPTPQGGFVGTPQAVLAGTYGRITGADVASDGLIWFTTANKGGGGPVTPTDDRVVRIRPPVGRGERGRLAAAADERDAARTAPRTPPRTHRGPGPPPGQGGGPGPRVVLIWGADQENESMLEPLEVGVVDLLGARTGGVVHLTGDLVDRAGDLLLGVGGLAADRDAVVVRGGLQVRGQRRGDAVDVVLGRGGVAADELLAALDGRGHVRLGEVLHTLDVALDATSSRVDDVLSRFGASAANANDAVPPVSASAAAAVSAPRPAILPTVLAWRALCAPIRTLLGSSSGVGG